ncbi:ATP-binding cassette domain-containing protein [Streptomyces sp. NPDC048018]|uniref:ABC transporter ATP-binding protein n=1 Tax=Streptomyces sp. NPDC048018 TaxID=3365499 RepID=UPI0037217B23
MILEGVGRRYTPRGPWVLREVGLDLPAGTLTRVTGTNGTGKSTLLRVIAGIDAPSAGRVSARPARTAYVPERFPAALPLTATGYLVHLARIQGLDGRTARARAGEWLDRFGASAYGNTPLAALSKGTSQKVAVAQALLAGPDLLVLDEAWTGLDTAARAELDRAVRERVAAGARVVFVDHDPARLEGEADAEYRVSAGRVHRTDRTVPATGPGAPVANGTRVGISVETTDTAAGTRIRIAASGGTGLPEGLPGSPACAVRGPRLVATVGADHSDTLLRALLDAGWHIEQLTAEATTEGAPL